MTTGIWSFALFTWIVAGIVNVASTGLYPPISGVLDIWDIKQFLNHEKSSSISQWIRRKLGDLQKLV